MRERFARVLLPGLRPVLFTGLGDLSRKAGRAKLDLVLEACILRMLLARGVLAVLGRLIGVRVCEGRNVFVDARKSVGIYFSLPPELDVGLELKDRIGGPIDESLDYHYQLAYDFSRHLKIGLQLLVIPPIIQVLKFNLRAFPIDNF